MGGAWTMAWKELRELVLSEGRPAAQLAVAGLLDLGFGIGIPLFLGFALDFTGWPAVLAVLGAVVGFCAFMGFLGPMPLIGDAYAGERERHTLETLLASPLRDGEIVRGKMLAQYVVVGGHVATVAVAAGITSAILFGLRGAVVLPGALLAGGLAGGATASFIVGLGTLISLRAPTVKKAQERIGYAMIPVFFLPGLAPTLVGGLAESAPAWLLVLVGTLVPATVVVGSIVFNVLAFARFRRDRLLGLP